LSAESRPAGAFKVVSVRHGTALWPGLDPADVTESEGVEAELTVKPDEGRHAMEAATVASTVRPRGGFRLLSHSIVERRPPAPARFEDDDLACSR